MTKISKNHTPYWVLALARAGVLFVPGLLITFTPGHTGQFGLVALGMTALAMAVLVGWLALGLPAGDRGRGFHLFQSAASLVIGLVALALNEVGIGLLLWCVVVWALLLGGAEVFAGIRAPRRDILRRDWITQGTSYRGPGPCRPYSERRQRRCGGFPRRLGYRHGCLSRHCRDYPQKYG